jgi:Protein of unknown function (DUF2778)
MSAGIRGSRFQISVATSDDARLGMGGMTFGTEWHNRFGGSDHRCLPPNGLPQRLLGGVALAFVASLCSLTVYVFANNDADQTDASRGDRFGAALTFADRFARANSLGAAPAPFDVRFSLDSQSGFANDAPRRSHGDFTALALFSDRFSAANQTTPVAPLPPRPDRASKSAGLSARLGPTHSAALRDGGQNKQTSSDTPENKPTVLQSILQKLFGKPAPVKLAYAASDDTGLSAGQSIAAGRYDQWTAVYDISAHTVYMPNGNRLEAHSGLGNWLDDPRYPDEKMRGVTPPNIYDLQLRENSFHGVRALRLIPEDEEKVFGRRGLLAHSYMLGPNGDSNGCVSIKDYDAFLQAYLNHDIKRLAVVTRLE